MNTHIELETSGKPLDTVQDLLVQLWQDVNLNHMLLPIKDGERPAWRKKDISSADELALSNPFTPIMVENIAQFVPAFIDAHPGEKLAVLLRPCEMRAMIKIMQTLQLNTENILFISADCLGTYPQEEFSWRASRKGSQENLSEDALRFARQGGIAAYRYRAACQLCENPIAEMGDININIVGLPVRQKMLVSLLNSKAKQMGFLVQETGEMHENLLLQHKLTAEKLIYRNQQTKQRLSEVLVENTNLEIESLVDQLNECGECTTCMDVCPICSTYNLSKDMDGNISREIVADWMISCVGCGMCEQSCSQHKPLAVIFSIINDQLAELNTID